MEKKVRPNIESEMDELQRAVQDLSRDEDIDISVEQLVDAFNNSNEETLTDDIWAELENTESNQIEKDNWKAVFGIARKYGKTDPSVLKKSIQKGTYKRPLIMNLGDRYILVAGNTRLCTAAAMGVNPKVFIARIDEDMNEASSPAQQAAIAINMKKKGIKPKQADEQYDDPYDETLPPPETNMGTDWRKKKKTETKEQTMAASAGAYSAPLFTTTKKKIQETIETSGQYDVPAFGATTKGRKSPLKIDGPESIYKGRAVKDKNFPKWGGPDSVFVKVKEKCKKFPYCNQGDINAIEIVKEDVELQETIKVMSEKYNIPVSHIENIVLNEINKIFI
jgi:hypothetical protein